MSELREALRHAREALPAANERETVICAIEGTHLRALVDALSAEPAQEMTDAAHELDDMPPKVLKALTNKTFGDYINWLRNRSKHLAVAQAERDAAQAGCRRLADRASRLPGIPSGWKIKRDDTPPFKCIEIHAPNGYGARVMSHERNPSNVLYMLAEAMLRGEKT